VKFSGTSATTCGNATDAGIFVRFQQVRGMGAAGLARPTPVRGVAAAAAGMVGVWIKLLLVGWNRPSFC